MDAFRNGLTAEQAAWASKKYHGHRTLPPFWRDDMQEAEALGIINTDAGLPI